MVGAYRVAEGTAALDLLAAGQVDLSQEVILEKPPSRAPVAGDSASAVVEKLGFNEIRIRTSAPAPSILVLSEIYYPDWSVEVDGTQAPIERANLYFRAVPLEQGEHDVVFRYRPASARLGLAVGLAAWIAWGLAVAIVAIRIGRKAPSSV